MDQIRNEVRLSCRHSYKRLALAGLLLGALSLMYGCSDSSESDGNACSLRVVFQQRTYTEIANVNFTAGKELGKGQIPDCSDGEPDDADSVGSAQSSTGVETDVFEVNGLDSSVALIANASGTPTAFVARDGSGEVPEEVKKFIDKSRPTSSS